MSLRDVTNSRNTRLRTLSMANAVLWVLSIIGLIFVIQRCPSAKGLFLILALGLVSASAIIAVVWKPRQRGLATLVGVSASAVGAWEYAKAKPEGPNREALVALRKLGKQEVAGILATKAAEPLREAKGRARGRRKRQ